MEDKRKNQKGKAEKEEKKKLELKHVFTAENILKFSKGRFLRVITAIIAVIVLAICFNYAYDYTKETIGDGAYKYSEDSYAYIEEAIQNYLGDDGPDIALLQDSIPYWTSTYENGQTTLVCPLKDGFFEPVVTAKISRDFKLIESSRNFNSLQEYQDYFWHEVKVSTFKTGAILFACIALCWLLISSTILCILKKMVEKKSANPKSNAKEPATEKNAEAMPLVPDTSV